MLVRKEYREMSKVQDGGQTRPHRITAKLDVDSRPPTSETKRSKLSTQQRRSRSFRSCQEHRRENPIHTRTIEYHRKPIVEFACTTLCADQCQSHSLHANS